MSTAKLENPRGEFGERLRNLRLAMGLSQPELAKKLEISNGTIGYWETGKTRPKPDTLKRLADILSVPVEQLLGAEKESDTLREVPPESDMNVWRRRAKDAEQELAEIKVILRNLSEGKINLGERYLTLKEATDRIQDEMQRSRGVDGGAHRK